MMPKFKYLIFSFLFFTFFAVPVLASESNGTIDITYKYAWGENLGWINFRPDTAGLAITDTAVTGYVWSKDFGWINFSPTTGGVTNNCAGQLGGNAWSEQKGWLSLSGATINSSGKFTGLAGTEGSSAGRINFGCANCDVRTDWRPCASRATETVVSHSSASGFVVTPIQNLSQKISSLRQQILALVAKLNLLKQNDLASQNLATVSQTKKETGEIVKNYGGVINFIAPVYTSTSTKSQTKTITVNQDEEESSFVAKVESVFATIGIGVIKLVRTIWQIIFKSFFPYY